MKIRINGTETVVRSPTVAALLAELGYGPRVATALNGDFLPAGQRPVTPLAEGDRLEVVAPMQGG